MGSFGGRAGALIDLSADGRARSFRAGDGEKGCLLLHGFTGTPDEMRPLGEMLAERGYTALCPLLPGHGTRVEDLAGTVWTDWFACALAAWDELGRTTKARVAAGLSMGALLALELAHERPAEVGALALLAPAMRLRNQRAAERSIWISRMRFLPRRLAIVAKRNAGRRTPSYDEVPIRALASMIHLQRVIAAKLSAIRTPTLILEGALDATLCPSAGPLVLSALASERKSRKVFTSSGHVLTEDPDAPEVLAAVASFFDDEIASGLAPR